MIDGVMTMHLKYALGPNISAVIRFIEKVSLKFGLVPEHFRKGLLIPILKENKTIVIQLCQRITVQ